ncbi:MAG: GatB/YqeY domain-containing protein, partial [Candidatus Eremiobacteraeota bacterium]|nr:GatB/YqeY domain-containing protein [Candidatus Eremiobacteraeota bacterium]
AMKARDADRMATLRMAISAMNYRRIERNEALTPEEQEDVLRKQVKQREDSIEEFTKGGRAELADKERREREILKEYLPAELAPDQLRAEVSAIVAKLGPDAKFGDAMKAVLPAIGKRANGRAIQEAVKSVMAKS